MSTLPYSFEPMPVEVAQRNAREQARKLNEGRYNLHDAEEVSLPAHLMVEDTRPLRRRR
jgi:hypothetical protein